MKHAGLSLRAVILSLLIAAGSVTLPTHYAAADDGFKGASYIITVTTSAGDFASRGVITLHADRTMSVIDSGQGGPTFFFSSQLGSWKPDSNGGLVARTIDFDYPPSAAIGRLDYTISFQQNGHQITGTIILIIFPLQANPLDGGGTVADTFTFTGVLVKP